jgi:N-acyl-D-amino-acid deacylase
MSEDNVKRLTGLPWMTFNSDSTAMSPEGAFLLSDIHPRAYGNFARLLGKYVREERTTTLQDAIRRLTALPAAHLSIRDRGSLTQGKFADIVVFDPATIQDRATYEKPHQLATGVSHVLVNGRFALRDGETTRLPTGRFVRGRAWTGFREGGCRTSAKDWTWNWK